MSLRGRFEINGRPPNYRRLLSEVEPYYLADLKENASPDRERIL